MSSESTTPTASKEPSRGTRTLRGTAWALAALPRELVSQSSDHVDFARFRGKRILVIGGGASLSLTRAL